MRLVVTADLHYNLPKSRALADEVIGEINRAGGDVLLVVGDTAGVEGDHLERCLEKFEFAGEKLFVAGNHELWARGEDSLAIYEEELPRRVREMGWRWLEGEPFVKEGVGIVGSVGWYDYSFAAETLGIPRRFYEAKVSPGAADYLGTYPALFEKTEDISEAGMKVVARWNDGKFVKLGMSDEAFLERVMGRLEGQLEAMRGVSEVVAGVHHVPFGELLPPVHSSQWDFARAYLGSGRIGELLGRFPNVKRVYCGHSHFGAEAVVGGMKAVNIGAGYRVKKFEVVELG